MPLLMYDEYHPGTRDKDSSPAKRPKMSAIVRECFWYYVKCLGSVDSVCSLELLYLLLCFIHPRYKEVQNYITEQLVEQHDPIGARNGVGHTTCRFLAVRLFYYQQQPVRRLVGRDQLTIGGPQLQLARTTFLSLILISRSIVIIVGATRT